MKKIIALIVSILAVTQLSFAAEFVDMPDNWATGALERAAENGLLTGSDNHIYPDNNLTRAEMATIVARAFGATKEADISAFTDVKPADWFYQSMSKAVAMGAFTGSGSSLNPTAPITRQEAFVVLSRVFSINLNPDIDETVLNDFSDAAEIADWAKKPLAAIIQSGYVGGSNGRLNPNNKITRAEFAAVMDRLVKTYIDDPSAAFPTEGNVMVRVSGVNLSGLSGDRMIIIGDGVGANDVMTIDNANLAGLLLIRSGKEVTVDGTFGRVRVVIPGVTLKFNNATSKFKGIYCAEGSNIELGTLTSADSTPAN